MCHRISTSLPVVLSLCFTWLLADGAEYFSPSTPNDATSAVETVASSAPSSASSEPTVESDVRRIARDAYVWGWPLVYVHNLKRGLDKVPFAGRRGGMPVAPPNELCMLTDYIDPSVSVVPCPNQDVVYGYGILDLAVEPVVLQVPDFGDRFWVYQLGDQRTDGFAAVGRMYDTKPGLYLIVGADWHDAAPPGITAVFRCPTRIGFCLPRVFLDDTAADRQAVLPIINRIMAYPLSRYTGEMKTYDWSRVRWLPKVGLGARSAGKWVDPETFFDVLAEVLDEVPPLPGEESRYVALRRLLEAADRDPQLKHVLVQSAIAAEHETVAPLFEFRNFGKPLRHHWTTITNGAAFGTDYLTRTAVARSNVFVNRDNETKYFYQDLDATGDRLDGRNAYRVTFAPGELPPAKGFWSLTLYDERHAFHANPMKRYSLGTKNKNLHFNADGTLTILVQSRPPTDAEQVNWLPAPDGKFSLYLRAYWPDETLTSGAWSPPPVVAAEELVAAGG